jgi:hypothetical protein
MNEIQRRIAATMWNENKNTYDMAMAIFGSKKVLVNVFPHEYADTEAIIYRNLSHIKGIAQRMRLRLHIG